jgi:CRP-like cAMP-binding protein
MLTSTTFDPPPNDPHKFLALIAYGRTTDDVAKDTEIFAQGDPAKSIYFIQDGRVRLTVTSEHGKQATVAMLKEGQFFGEGCLVDQSFRIVSATAHTDCRITRIEAAAISEALDLQPAFAKFFMEHLLSKNSRIEAYVIDQLINSSEKRLARRLLILANYGQEGSPPIVPVTVDEEALAEMIGTTRSRISFFLNKFRERGFIDYGDEIVVHQALLNFVLQDKTEINKPDQ